MEFTQQEMLAMLEESGRNNWNIRQMTQLRSEGLLPKLTSKRKPGTNKPLNFWDETDIDQIVTVYDLLEYYDGSHETASLVLWLEGYNFSLDLMRKMFLRPVENYLQRLTQGESDPDEIAFSVSSIAMMFINKLRFTPGLTEQRKKLNANELGLFTQILLDILSGQEPDNEMLSSFCRSLFPNDEEILEQSQRVVEVARDIFALQGLCEIIRTATLEHWLKVREDYLSFCNILGTIGRRRIDNGGEFLPDDFLMGLKIRGALWLTSPLLSTRYRGYGQWIDKALEKIYEFLADPEIEEQIRNRLLPQ